MDLAPHWIELGYPPLALTDEGTNAAVFLVDIADAHLVVGHVDHSFRRVSDLRITIGIADDPPSSSDVPCTCIDATTVLPMALPLSRFPSAAQLFQHLVPDSRNRAYGRWTVNA